MHATFLCIQTPKYIDEVADQVKRFESSRQEFENFFVRYGRTLPYTHEQFLTDAKRYRGLKRRAPFEEGGISYLAREIIHERKCPCFCMDTYFHVSSLNRGGLAVPEGADHPPV